MAEHPLGLQTSRLLRQLLNMRAKLTGVAYNGTLFVGIANNGSGAQLNGLGMKLAGNTAKRFEGLCHSRCMTFDVLHNRWMCNND